MPLHVSSTCAHHQEVKIALHSLWYHHTYRWPSRAQVERGLLSWFTAALMTRLIQTTWDSLRNSRNWYFGERERKVGKKGENSKKIWVLPQPVHETATYRCDDTRGCVMQFWPPDDEHMCSTYVEAWNKLIVKQKFFASSWLISKINLSFLFH